MTLTLNTALPRRAVLIDLDNLLTIDRDTDRDVHFWADQTQALDRLSRAVELAGHADFTLAVGGRWSWLAGWAALQALDVPGRMCAGKDSAEDELLEQARHLAQHGFDAVTVVSGDGAFAELAETDGLRLTVVAPTWACTSRRLVSAAGSVQTVSGPRPGRTRRGGGRRGRC